MPSIKPDVEAMKADDGSSFRYGAFISYRHDPKDRVAAKWLHTSLERYRLPKAAAKPGVRIRVGRVFRDEEELAASSDLSREIDEALEQSRFLIVVCSPNTPSSRWINQEVIRFRDLGRSDRILALLIEGEPEESFPTALHQIRLDAGGAMHDPVEPLAADLRPKEGESARQIRDLAKLKLLATLLGCRFDDLRQREQERRTKRAVQAGALLASVLAIVAGLAIFSLLLYFREQVAHQLALGRQLVAQAGLTAAQRPELHETSVLLAAEGLRRLARQGAQSVESDQAFRATMDLLPRPVSAVSVDPPVQTLGVDANGSAFAIVREDGLVQLFRTGAEAPAVELQLDGDLQALTFTRRGELLGIADGNAATVIDVETGAHRARVTDLNGAKRGRFSRDMKWYVAMGDLVEGAEAETDVTVWNLETGERMFHRRVAHDEASRDDAVRSAPRQAREPLRALLAWLTLEGIPHHEEFTPKQKHVGPNGRYLAQVGFVEDAGYIMVYDGWTGATIETYGSGEGLPRTLFSSSGQHIVTIEGDTATLMPVPPRAGDHRGRQGVFRRIRAEGAIRELAFSTDGRFMATVVGRVARVWELRSGNEVCRAVQGEPIDQLALSERGGYLLTVAGHTSRLWGCERNRSAAGTMGFDPTFGAISPDGKLISRVRRPGIRVLEFESGRELAVLGPVDGGAQDMVWSSDASRLAAGRQKVPVRVWSVPSGRLMAFTGPMSTLQGQPLAFSPDGRFLAVLKGHKSTTVWNLETEERVGELTVGFKLGVRLGANGRYLTAIDHRRVRRVWDVPKGQLINGGSERSAVTLIGEGGLLATARDGAIDVLSLAGDMPGHRFDTSGRVQSMALSSNGHYLAFAVDEKVFLWRLEPLELVGELPTETAVRDLVFDPDASVLAALTRRFLQLWRIEDRRRFAELPLEAMWFAETGTVPRIGFLRSGKLLWMSVSSDLDRVWLWRTDEMVEAACAWLTDENRARDQRHTFLGEEPPAVRCSADKGSKPLNLEPRRSS